MGRQQVGPYINFQGRAREALEFYHKVLGGKLGLYAVNGGGEPKPAGPGDRIAYARLEADGMVIIGSDGHPDYPAKAGDTVAVALRSADPDLVTRAFNGLAEGGKVKMPLTSQAWGTSGWLTDRFGINWSVSVEKW